MSIDATTRNALRRISLIVVIVLCRMGLYGQLSVTVDKPEHRYFEGETINFQIQSGVSGDVSYLIRRDPLTPVVAAGNLSLTAGVASVVSFSPPEAGNYFCIVVQDTLSASTAALYVRRQLAPLEQEPDDFQTYWADIRSRLDTIPIDAQVEEDTSVFYQSPYSTTYRISLASIDGRRAYAYMVVPHTSGQFTGLIKFPAFGNSDAAQPDLPMAERLGAIVISLSIHNAPVNVNLPQSELYVPDINTSDTVYYRWAIAAGMRAIDFLETLPQFDGTHVGVYGVSQGAGLALLLSGVDDRVDLAAVSNPILSQHCGLKYQKPSGFPKYIRDVLNDTIERDRILNAVKYYDVVYAIRHFTGPLLATVSHQDEVTPAEVTFTALNQHPGETILLHNLLGLHGDNPPQYWDGKFDFFRRYFPVNYSWPPAQYSLDQIGYEVDAGADQTVTGLQATVTGTIDDNGVTNPSYFDVHWEVVSGPGTVTFDDSTAYTTAVDFSTAGLYRLRFVGENMALLASEHKFYTIDDLVEVNVCPGNNCSPLPVAWLRFDAIPGDGQVRLVWQTAVEKDNDGFALMRSADGYTWERLGFVPAAKNPDGADVYHWTDTRPLDGINYYQVIQIDASGHATASPVRSVRISPPADSDKTLRVYPNPSSGRIRIDGYKGEALVLHVINASGEEVLVSGISAARPVDASALPRGTYYLRFSDGVHAFYRQWVKSR